MENQPILPIGAEGVKLAAQTFGGERGLSPLQDVHQTANGSPEAVSLVIIGVLWGYRSEITLVPATLERHLCCLNMSFPNGDYVHAVAALDEAVPSNVASR